MFLLFEAPIKWQNAYLEQSTASLICCEKDLQLLSVGAIRVRLTATICYLARIEVWVIKCLTIPPVLPLLVTGRSLWLITLKNGGASHTVKQTCYQVHHKLLKYPFHVVDFLFPAESAQKKEFPGKRRQVTQWHLSQTFLQLAPHPSI
jgi:hypothetical protein